MHNDVEDEPEGPVLAIVAAQQGSKWQQEAPGQVHEDAMEVDEGEVVVWTAGGLAVLPGPGEQPQVTHNYVWVPGECVRGVCACVCVCV